MTRGKVKNKPFSLLVAGGGTGGHLFPGIAVAQAVRHMAPESRILFVGTNKPFEKKAVNQAGFEQKGINVEGFKGRGVKNQAVALFKLALALLRGLWTVACFRPRVVLGVGGYSSVPCVAAGALAFCKCAVAEQNAQPGVANRLLARFVGRIYASFEESTRFFPKEKVRVTGNPVRETLLDEVKEKDAYEDNFTLAVIGGSQGAACINRAVVEALPLLEKTKVSFIHQTGEADLETVSRAYAAWGGDHEVKPFFHDMGRVYGQADVLICRSGASTVAELAALGKPAVFIPFAQAADNHQEKNAQLLVDAKAAQMILEPQLTGRSLAEAIKELAAGKPALADMAAQARSLGKPGAGAAIARDLLQWAGYETPAQEPMG